MLMTILNVLYVLIAVAMIALILMQRGAGAQAGSGFGAGASATVFGARGAGNFLSKSTKWLAIAFFAISLFLAWNHTRAVRAPATQQAAQTDLGLMSDVPVAPAAQAPAASAVPAAPTTVNNAGSAVPTAPAQATTTAAPVNAAPSQND